MGAHTEDDGEDRGANVSAAHLSLPFAALGKSNQGRSVARGPRYEALGARGRFRGLVFDRASAEWRCRLGRGAAVGWPTWRMFARMAVALFGTLAWAAESVHTVPYVPSAASVGHAGLVRIESRSGVSGAVSVVAVDDAGQRVETGLLTLGAMAVIEFEAGAMESGDASLGLTGTGPGEGDWRLELTTELDIEARAYARSEGFVTALHDAVLLSGEVELPFFNPGGDARRSVLRLANARGEPAAVSVRGVDDAGVSGGPATVELGPWEARSYAASELESGSAAGLTGSLGDGDGRWRLTLSADRGSAYAMNLLLDGSGVLSSVPGGMSRGGFHRVPLFPSASDGEGRRGVVRVVNGSADSAEVSIEAFDATDRAYERLELTLAGEASGQFDSSDLEQGNAAKGLTGSTGPGEGDWWLELTSASNIEVLSYVDTALGPLSALRGTSGVETESGMRYEALLWGESGEVRLLNAGGALAEVRLSGVDDAGSSGGAAELTLAPWSARTLTATAVAEGEAGMRGALGAGGGSWRLRLEADRELDVLSLVRGSGGMLSDVSRRGRPAGAPPRTEVIDATARGRPDLWVAASASDAELSPGEAFELTATVGNRGGSEAPPTTLRYHRSADATITTSDTQLGTDAVAALAPAVAVATSLTLNAPSEPGTYYFGACVDAVRGESGTANNCSAGVALTVRAPAAQPDLDVKASLSAGAVRPGEAFELLATVRNRGGAQAQATTLRYYRSTDATITTSDTQLGTDAVAALAPAVAVATSLTLNAPSEPGTYYFGACVDAVRGESGTANNCSAGVALTVRAPAAQPDLDVKASLSAGAVRPGEAFELLATVRNRGGAQAQATTLRYYRSTDATITTADTEEGADAVEGLAASGTSTGSIALTSQSTADTYYYGACADAVPDESDRTNNCSVAQALTVRGPPDLAVTVSPSLEGWCAKTRIETAVRNAGPGAAPSTTLRYYRSTGAAGRSDDGEVGSVEVPDLPPSAAWQHAFGVPPAPDTRHYYACVDAVPDETNADDNCSSVLAATAVSQKDLVGRTAWSKGLSRIVLEPGAPLNFGITVGNNGIEEAWAEVRAYRSEDATITSDDTVFRRHGPLHRFRGCSEGLVWGLYGLFAPSTPGTYYYGGCAGVVEGESDTTNNCTPSLSVTVQ